MYHGVETRLLLRALTVWGYRLLNVSPWKDNQPWVTLFYHIYQTIYLFPILLIGACKEFVRDVCLSTLVSLSESYVHSLWEKRFAPWQSRQLTVSLINFSWLLLSLLLLRIVCVVTGDWMVWWKTLKSFELDIVANGGLLSPVPFEESVLPHGGPVEDGHSDHESH